VSHLLAQLFQSEKKLWKSSVSLLSWSATWSRAPTWSFTICKFMKIAVFFVIIIAAKFFILSL